MNALSMPSYRYVEEYRDCNGQTILKHTDFTADYQVLGSFEETAFANLESECNSQFSAYAFLALKFLDKRKPGSYGVWVYIHDAGLVEALGGLFGRTDFGISHATALRVMDEGWLWVLAYMRAQDYPFPPQLGQPLRQLVDEFLKSPKLCGFLATGSLIFKWLILLLCNVYERARKVSTVDDEMKTSWTGVFTAQCNTRKLERGHWVDLAMFALGFLAALFQRPSVVPSPSTANNALRATMSWAFHQLTTEKVGVTIPQNLLPVYKQSGYLNPSMVDRYITHPHKVLFPFSYPSVRRNLPIFMCALELALQREINVLHQPIPRHINHSRIGLLASSSAPTQLLTTRSIRPRRRQRNDTISRFRCNRCGERFTTVTNFNRHNSSSKCATAKQTFVCRQCGKLYNRKDNRDKHEQKVHGLEKSHAELEVV